MAAQIDDSSEGYPKSLKVPEVTKSNASRYTENFAEKLSNFSNDTDTKSLTDHTYNMDILHPGTKNCHPKCKLNQSKFSKDLCLTRKSSTVKNDNQESHNPNKMETVGISQKQLGSFKFPLYSLLKGKVYKESGHCERSVHGRLNHNIWANSEKDYRTLKENLKEKIVKSHNDQLLKKNDKDFINEIETGREEIFMPSKFTKYNKERNAFKVKSIQCSGADAIKNIQQKRQDQLVHAREIEFNHKKVLVLFSVYSGQDLACRHDESDYSELYVKCSGHDTEEKFKPTPVYLVPNKHYVKSQVNEISFEENEKMNQPETLSEFSLPSVYFVNEIDLNSQFTYTRNMCEETLVNSKQNDNFLNYKRPTSSVDNVKHQGQKPPSLSTDQGQKPSSLPSTDQGQKPLLSTDQRRKPSSLFTDKSQKPSSLFTDKSRKPSSLFTDQSRKPSSLSPANVKHQGQKPSSLSTDKGQKPSSLSTDDGQKSPSLSTDQGQKPSSLSTDQRRKPSSLSPDQRQKPSSLSTDQRQKHSSLSQDQRRKPSSLSPDQRQKPSSLSTDQRQKPSSFSTDQRQKPSSLSTDEGQKPSSLSTDLKLEVAQIVNKDSNDNFDNLTYGKRHVSLVSNLQDAQNKRIRKDISCIKPTYNIKIVLNKRMIEDMQAFQYHGDFCPETECSSGTLKSQDVQNKTPEQVNAETSTTNCNGEVVSSKQMTKTRQTFENKDNEILMRKHMTSAGRSLLKSAKRLKIETPIDSNEISKEKIHINVVNSPAVETSDDDNKVLSNDVHKMFVTKHTSSGTLITEIDDAQGSLQSNSELLKNVISEMHNYSKRFVMKNYPAASKIALEHNYIKKDQSYIS